MPIAQLAIGIASFIRKNAELCPVSEAGHIFLSILPGGPPLFNQSHLGLMHHAAEKRGLAGEAMAAAPTVCLRIPQG
jgi:hypothetical protein